MRWTAFRHIWHETILRQWIPDHSTGSLAFILSATHPGVRARVPWRGSHINAGARHKTKVWNHGDAASTPDCCSNRPQPGEQYIYSSQPRNCENESAAWRERWPTSGRSTVIIGSPLAGVDNLWSFRSIFNITWSMDGELALELLSWLLDIDSPCLLILAVMSFLRITQKTCRRDMQSRFPLNAQPSPKWSWLEARSHLLILSGESA